MLTGHCAVQENLGVRKSVSVAYRMNTIGLEVIDAGETPSSCLVHEFHPWRVGSPLDHRWIAVERRVLRRHGEGDGTSLLRLHHDRGHVDGVRDLRRQRR